MVPILPATVFALGWRLACLPNIARNRWHRVYNHAVCRSHHCIACKIQFELLTTLKVHLRQYILDSSSVFCWVDNNDSRILTYCGYCWTSYFGIFFASGSLCSDLTETSKHIRVHTLLKEKLVVNTNRRVWTLFSQSCRLTWTWHVTRIWFSTEQMELAGNTSFFCANCNGRYPFLKLLMKDMLSLVVVKNLFLGSILILSYIHLFLFFPGIPQLPINVGYLLAEPPSSFPEAGCR